jgi:hypothetical protein
MVAMSTGQVGRESRLIGAQATWYFARNWRAH